MTTYMHFMHTAKLYKLDEGMLIFVSEKNLPLLFAKDVIENTNSFVVAISDQGWQASSILIPLWKSELF